MAPVVGVLDHTGVRPMPRIALLFATSLAASVGALPALASTLSDTDTRFLADTAQGASHELAISRLAAEQATRPAVKSYASMVVSNHQAMNTALRKLAKQKGATLPVGMSASSS